MWIWPVILLYIPSRLNSRLYISWLYSACVTEVLLVITLRSSRLEVFHATSLKKRLWRRCFPVNFAKCLRAPFFIVHLRRLFLCTFVLWMINNASHASRCYRGTMTVRYFYRKCGWRINGHFKDLQESNYRGKQAFYTPSSLAATWCWVGHGNTCLKPKLLRFLFFIFCLFG